MSIVLGIAAAFGLFVLGSIFGLNGAQWDWWQSASWAAAAVVLVAAVWPSKLRPARLAGRRSSALTVGLSGAAVVAASTAVMADRYSDPYSGPRFWPDTLAVLAFIGFTALVGSGVMRRGKA